MLKIRLYGFFGIFGHGIFGKSFTGDSVGVFKVCLLYKRKKKYKRNKKVFAEKFLKNPFQKVHKFRIGAEVSTFIKNVCRLRFFNGEPLSAKAYA